MLRRVLLLLLCGIPLLPARANLGETIPQLIARYGRPVGYAEASAKSPLQSLLFRAGGYELALFMVNQVEVGARVSKTDKTAFTDAEIQTIMDAETSGDAKWIPVPSGDPTTLQWSRSDHATFMYDKEKHMLLLTSDAMAEAIRAAPTTAPAKPGP